MSDISFISLLNATLVFLTTTYSAPVWLLLILFTTSIPQFVKIYRWIRRSKEAEELAKRIQPTAKNISQSITDNKFAESMVTTVQKLKSLPEDKLAESMVTTVNKIKNVAHSATEAASDGIAAAAKKFETEMNNSENDKTPVSKKTDDKEEVKNIILKQLFKVGDNGRLPQSIASDLKMSNIIATGYLKELTETKLISQRKTMLGQTYFITKLGKAFCEKQGFEK